MLYKLEDIDGAIISLETDEGIFSNVDIPLWQPTVFEKLSETPLPDVFYKIIVSSNTTDLHEYMDDILDEDTYVSVADGVLFQIMSRQATKWNGIEVKEVAEFIFCDLFIYSKVLTKNSKDHFLQNC